MDYELGLDFLTRGAKLIDHLRSRQSRAHAYTWNDILDRIYVPDRHTGLSSYLHVSVSVSSPQLARAFQIRSIRL